MINITFNTIIIIIIIINNIIIMLLIRAILFTQAY